MSSWHCCRYLSNSRNTWAVLAQEDVKQELVSTSEQLIQTQAQRDRNAMKLEQIAQRQGMSAGEAGSSQHDAEEPDESVLTGHLKRIASLEKEVKRLKQVCVAKLVIHVNSRLLCANQGYS